MCFGKQKGWSCFAGNIIANKPSGAVRFFVSNVSCDDHRISSPSGWPVGGDALGHINELSAHDLIGNRQIGRRLPAGATVEALVGIVQRPRPPPNVGGTRRTEDCGP